MLTFIRKLWEHKFYASFSFSETGAVRGVRIRAFWPCFGLFVVFFGWLGVVLAGAEFRAELARMAGNEQAAQYLDRIATLEEERSLRERQVDMIAKELGQLQARLDRFDVLSEKLANDTEFSVLLEAENLPEGQGGITPAETDYLESIPEMVEQVSVLRREADRTETALETGLALMLSQQSSMAGVPRIFPVIHGHARISSAFGWRHHPILKRRQWHDGLDIAADWDAPIVSAADGVVVYAGYRFGYGITVDVRHANGFMTRYTHMGEAAVKNGDVLQAGDLIGLMGSTGRSTGPHVHFEVIKDDEKINPWPFVRNYKSLARKQGQAGKGEELIADWRQNQQQAALR